MSAYMTSPLPDDLFDRLAALSNKPIAMTETGYPAETFTYAANGTALTFESDTDKQNRYINLLLDAAQNHNFRFVINFVLRDYDRLWSAMDLPELGIVWKDTGLYDGEGNPRTGLECWREALALPVQ
jgi:hypothetical protein